MNKPALTTALLASLALTSLFTSGCVVGDEELECDASEESADCDETLGTSEDMIKGAIDTDLARANCESRKKVWNSAKMTCGGCISGYVPSGDKCISKKESDCYTKLDGVWQNGVCVTSVECEPGMHAVSGGYGQPQHCVFNDKPVAPYPGDLPCEVGMTCFTDPNPHTWYPPTPGGWQPMGPNCMDPGDIGCFGNGS